MGLANDQQGIQLLVRLDMIGESDAVGVSGEAAREVAKSAFAEEADQGYEVESILDMEETNTGEVLYLLKWVGFDESHNSWEPEGNLDCPVKIAEFTRAR